MEGLIGFSVFIVALLLFLATGTPVAVATGLLGVVGVWLFLPPAAIAQLGNIAFAQSGNFVLVVVPLFVMMGEALAVTDHRATTSSPRRRSGCAACRARWPTAPSPRAPASRPCAGRAR